MYVISVIFFVRLTVLFVDWSHRSYFNVLQKARLAQVVVYHNY